MQSKGKMGGVLIVLLLLMASGLQAGGFRMGLELGANYTDVETKTIWKETSETGGFYYDIFLPLEYEFTRSLSLSSGVHWRTDRSRKIQSFTEVSDGKPVTMEINNYTRVRHFLEFPLTLRFTCSLDPVILFIGAGGYVGVYLGMWQYGTIFDPATSADRISTFSATAPESGDNRFTAGLIAEAGIGGEIGRGRVYLVCRYSYCLTSLAKAQKAAVNIYFQNVTINLGYTLFLGGGR